jgi:predicted GH43/DUF377 family glycosyl hydrolase
MMPPEPSASNTDDFSLTRRGVVQTPDLSDPYEAGGVLNPAAVLRDGLTFVFYRAVAVQPHNYSRILIATCRVSPDSALEVYYGMGDRAVGLATTRLAAVNAGARIGAADHYQIGLAITRLSDRDQDGIPS